MIIPVRCLTYPVSGFFALGVVCLALGLSACDGRSIGTRSGDEPPIPVWQLSDDSLSIGSMEGDEPFLFHDIRDVVPLSMNRVAVLDGGTGEVRVFGDDGSVVWRAGSLGEGPSEFQYPSWIREMPGGDVAVFDHRQPMKLVIFDSAGKYQRSEFINHEATGWPGRVLPALGDGTLFSIVNSVTTIDLEGESFKIFTDSTTYALVHAEGLDTVLVLPGRESWGYSDGHYSTADLLPFGRRELNASGSSFAAVSHGLEPSVTLIHADGRDEDLELPLTPQPLTQAHWEAERSALLEGLDSLSFRLRQGAWQQVPRPEYLPYFVRLLVDSQDRIWIAEHSAGDLQTWRVFDRSGAPIATMEVPTALGLVAADDSYLVGKMQDELDVERVLRWRIER